MIGLKPIFIIEYPAGTHNGSLRSDFIVAENLRRCHDPGQAKMKVGNLMFAQNLYGLHAILMIGLLGCRHE